MASQPDLTLCKPLSSAREETYAKLRAQNIPSSQACIEAGYPNSHNATRLENRTRIQRRIREFSYYDDLDIAATRRMIRDELMNVAFFQLASLFVEDAQGNRKMRPIAEWSEEDHAAIAELVRDKDGVDRVKAHSKLSAIDLLMKLDGLAEPERVDVNHSGSTELNVNVARERISGRIQAIAGRTSSLSDS